MSTIYRLNDGNKILILKVDEIAALSFANPKLEITFKGNSKPMAIVVPLASEFEEMQRTLLNLFKET